MDKASIIGDLYFCTNKNVVEIAQELNVSKQYVSKILKEKFNEQYIKEKEKRKEINMKQRNKTKCKKIAEARKKFDWETAMKDLKSVHESDSRYLSNRGRMTNESFVYHNLNAYDVKGNSLVYNKKIGAMPHDLPRSFSLKINVYNENKKER